ncbi:hypothetical protein [Lysobacter sp. A03]|uniref:hypothetical protein n=1 Tax=Lysobacter sp. A03 TaxID=1199154 RepID=UPI0005B6D281|nr:hypothetical protein [Lysobacter sp. A03]KIQ96810.1 hypothetical protein TI01_1669 [Lysobacter sp. A03]
MKFLALIYFVLSLFGCDIGGSSYVTRTTVEGTDTLYSQTTTRAGVARFECLRSASGACHYTVLAHGCAPTSGPDQARSGSCESGPIERFTVAYGESRQIAGLTGFDLCVSAEDDAVDSACDRPRQ